MLDLKNAPKKATNLSLNSKVLEMARELDINLSQTVDALLAEEVKRLYWEKWRHDNRDAMAAYDERIAEDGLPLAKYRSFARGLGDGKQG
ncbi:MAG: post-segregation antitoxin CcdA [Polaromonas sp.]|nr:post-segregation antitoxin CcdA [Polaromonas sp.]